MVNRPRPRTPQRRHPQARNVAQQRPVGQRAAAQRVQQSARRAEGGFSEFMRIDPFGVLFLSLAFLAVMVAKWWVISADQISGDNCVACVVAVVWFLALAVSLLSTGFWLLWSSQGVKDAIFAFMLGVVAILSSIFLYFLTQYVVSKLYFAGYLNWQEDQAGYLLDDFLKHSVGLFLVVAVLYSMIRLFFCKDLVNKGLALTVSGSAFLGALPLFYLGVWLY